MSVESGCGVSTERHAARYLAQHPLMCDEVMWSATAGNGRELTPAGEAVLAGPHEVPVALIGAQETVELTVRVRRGDGHVSGRTTDDSHVFERGVHGDIEGFVELRHAELAGPQEAAALVVLADKGVAGFRC